MREKLPTVIVRARISGQGGNRRICRAIEVERFVAFVYQHAQVMRDGKSAPIFSHSARGVTPPVGLPGVVSRSTRVRGVMR